MARRWYPLFEICDWEGKEVPSKEQIDQFGLKKGFMKMESKK